MNKSKIDLFRANLAGSGTLGVFSKTEDPAMIEAMALGGLDFVILDLEHGPNTILNLQNLVRAAEAGGCVPLVRVPEEAWGMISAALDIGAGGVQVPQIRSGDDARKAISHARFAPLGTRGVCRYVRAAEYSGMDKSAYFRCANEALLILQLEGKEALDNLDEILDVPGYDILFVGPYDLSQSLGLTGQVDHPDVVATVERIVRRGLERGIAVGTFVENMRTASFWRSRGVRYICYSVDVGLLHDTCSRLRQDFNQESAACSDNAPEKAELAHSL